MKENANQVSTTSFFDNFILEIPWKFFNFQVLHKKVFLDDATGRFEKLEN